MVGQTISHYRIVSQLGAGGMGVVYAAEDHRLGRSVALKFVPDDLARDQQALERLRGEARTASALNHPNICTIYDIDDHEGRPFIVMELLKGQTLRDRLAAAPLRIHEIVDLGIQIADALDWAHANGVIHRDIKPANLFLVDRGHVKIVDFGLAKLLSRQPSSLAPDAPTITASADLTAEGVTLGTVAYMSPEQVTGEELDGRTDIFSFGVVLYECVTGHQPFTGKTSAVVLSAILNKAPVAPMVFNPELPIRLQEAITNCLEKDRELRYQHASDLRADLRRAKRDLESGQTGVMRAVSVHAPDEPFPPSASSTHVPASTAKTQPMPAPAPTPGPIGVRRSSFNGAIAVVVAIGVMLAGAASYWLWRRAPQPAVVVGGGPTDALIQSRLESAAANLRSKNYGAALSQAEEVLQSAPDRAEAIRIRDEARATIARFDGAIAKATALLDAGDADAASAAIDAARVIDPAAPVVSELSARMVNQFKARADAARKGSSAQLAPPVNPPQRSPGDAGRRASSDAARPESPRPAAPAEPLNSAAQAAPPTPVAPPAAAAAPGASSSSGPQPVSPPPPASSTSIAPAPPVQPAPAPAASEPVAPSNAASARRETTAPAPAASEDDDAAIRRVVATYAHAIETKDVALFRSVKPNMSPQEQRRIEEGFRAVSSQKVTINILGIERRGQDALVRLRRRDAIEAGGRLQTSETQQTMTLTRSGSAWVIREIGR
jgi:serine/threonine protein kinase